MRSVVSGNMMGLDEVQEFFRDGSFALEESRIEQLYAMIDNKASRINDFDKQWVACAQDHEIETVVTAIQEIRDEGAFRRITTHDPIMEKVLATCEEFKDYTHKPRIPFYILVLDKLEV